MTPTTTHLLPHYPPTTHPLGWGEGVFKIVNTVDFDKCKSLAATLKFFSTGHLATALFPYSTSHLGRVKGTQNYFIFDPTPGWIEDIAAMDIPYNDTFFNVVWWFKTGDIKNVEASSRLVRMEDVDIFTKEEFVAILK
jgi:hypothetical protein